MLRVSEHYRFMRTAVSPTGQNYPEKLREVYIPNERETLEEQSFKERLLLRRLICLEEVTASSPATDSPKTG